MKEITRRAFSASIPMLPAACAALARHARAAPAVQLRATVLMDGGTYVYDEAAGKNLGGYVDPAGRFTMSCVRVTRSDCPLRVDFRAIPGWSCAIFDYGDAFSANRKNLRGYSVTIAGQTINLPGHPWGSRWRWQSGPWPLPMTSIDDLVAQKLLLAFDPAAPRGTAPNGFRSTYSPLAFESAGLDPRMPNTGERQEIGYVTDIQAQYICTRNAANLAGVLAQGEAGGSPPWRFFDPNTGRTVDGIIQFPKASIDGGNPAIYLNPLSTFNVTLTGPANSIIPNGQAIDVTANKRAFNCTIPTGGTIGASGSVTLGAYENGWAAVDPTGGTVTGLPAGVKGTVATGSYMPSSGVYLESAHMPAISYLPFLLTGDPYFLENLHSQVMFAFFEAERGGIYNYLPGIIQVRAAAWNFRSIYQAAAMTPAETPSWILPKSVMMAAFKFCLNGMTNLITNPPQGPVQSIFHDISPTGWPIRATWQADFFALVSSAAALPHPQWTPVLQFVVQNLIARLDGTSGWCNGSPDPYGLQLTRGPNGPPWFGSWAEAWAANNGGNSACPPLETSTPPRGQMDYINGMRAALAAATQALARSDPLRAQAQRCLDFLAPYHSAWLGQGQRMEYKWAIKRITP